MSHTRTYLEKLIGKRVYLQLKNGKEYVGTLRHSRFRSFGFAIDFNTIQADTISISNSEEFVFSKIKKIRAITIDEIEKEMKELHKRTTLSGK